MPVMQEAHGKKLQVNSGMQGNFPSKTKKQPQEDIIHLRKDECPSLAVGTMALQETFHHIDNKLEIIDERTTFIYGTLLSHTKWQVDIGHEMTNLQQ